jgi:hypothetical protein
MIVAMMVVVGTEVVVQKKMHAQSLNFYYSAGLGAAAMYHPWQLLRTRHCVWKASEPKEKKGKCPLQKYCCDSTMPLHSVIERRAYLK